MKSIQIIFIKEYHLCIACNSSFFENFWEYLGIFYLEIVKIKKGVNSLLFEILLFYQYYIYQLECRNNFQSYKCLVIITYSCFVKGVSVLIFSQPIEE